MYLQLTRKKTDIHNPPSKNGKLYDFETDRKLTAGIISVVFHILTPKQSIFTKTEHWRKIM